MQISGRVVRAGGRNPMGESEMFDCRGFFEVPREQYAPRFPDSSLEIIPMKYGKKTMEDFV